MADNKCALSQSEGIYQEGSEIRPDSDAHLTIMLCKSNTCTHLVNNKSPQEAGSLTTSPGATSQACATFELCSTRVLIGVF